MSVRHCPYCGKSIPAEVLQCPHCGAKLRPYVAEPGQGAHTPVDPQALIRRGLLWMLLAGAVFYFAAGHSPWELPFRFHPMLADWVLPLLFLAGFGQMGYGIYCWFTR
jgi:hypothetical protein